MAVDQKIREFSPKFRDIVAKAWSDEAFKARLLADPTAVLIEQGIEIPPDKRVRLIEPVEGTQLALLPPNTDQGATMLDALVGRSVGPAGEQAEKYAQLVHQVWADRALHDRLVKEPRAVLADRGIEVPADRAVQVLELAPDEVPFTLPPKPDSGELSDEQLNLIIGGVTTNEIKAFAVGYGAGVAIFVVIAAAAVA